LISRSNQRLVNKQPLEDLFSNALRNRQMYEIHR